MNKAKTVVEEIKKVCSLVTTEARPLDAIHNIELMIQRFRVEQRENEGEPLVAEHFEMEK